jgi:hypothetical protein
MCVRACVEGLRILPNNTCVQLIDKFKAFVAAEQARVEMANTATLSLYPREVLS